MKPKSSPPKTVAALIAGIIFVLAFAVWNISRSVSPAAPAAPSVVAVAPSPAPTPVTPFAGSATAVLGANARPAAGSEASLAPAADPFTPLAKGPGVSADTTGSTASTAAPRPAQVASAAGPDISIKPMPGVGTSSPVRPGGVGAVRVPPAAMGTLPPGASLAGNAPATQVTRRPPLLVGTILGDHPSAVFQESAHMAVVPLGAKVGPWKVIAVGQGSAVVVTATRKVRLHVGAARPEDAVETAPPVEIAETAVAAAPEPPRVAGSISDAPAAPAVLAPRGPAEYPGRLPDREHNPGVQSHVADRSAPSAAPPGTVASHRLLHRVSRTPATSPRATPPPTRKTTSAAAPDIKRLSPHRHPGMRRRGHHSHHWHARHRSHYHRAHHLFGRSHHRRFHRHHRPILGRLARTHPSAPDRRALRAGFGV